MAAEGGEAAAPLWVWAVVVAGIIASKFLLRWSRLRRLARELSRSRS